MKQFLFISQFSLLCYLALVSEARYLKRVTATGGEELSIIKCSCSVWAELYDDSPYYSFGVIQTFHVDPTQIHNAADPQCHHIRHQCKKECELRADLGATVEDNKPLGLKLCEKFGIDTKHGGTFMISHARLEGEGCGIDTNQDEAFLARSEVHDQKFCCSHTTMTKGDREVNLFGWNPDCKNKEYIFV